jgi:hypothetical protein
MITENRKQQLRNLAKDFGGQIKLDRNNDRLAATERGIEQQIGKLGLSREEMDFLLDETRYVIDPGSRPSPDGRRIILDHDVSAFLKVVAQLRSRLAPKSQK